MAVKNVQKIIIIVTVQISLTLLARGQCKLNSNYTSDQFKLHRIVVNVSLNDKHTSCYPASATLSFYAMGTKITLSLNKDNSIVNPQYNIYIINKDGTKTKMKRKRKNAYRGTVNMDAKHRVNAIVVEGRWYVSFERPERVLFFMEPDLDLGVRSNRAYSRLLHPMVVYQLHDHVRSGMRRKAMPRWNINKPLSKRKFATKSKQSARLRLKRGKVDLPKVVPTPDSGSRYQALSSSGQSYKWIYKNYNQKKVEQSADLCNVLIVTESDAWKSFGLKDYNSLASLLDFVFQQVDYILRELWPGKFTTAGLQLKTVYIHNIYGDDSAGEEHRELHGFLRETAKPNFLNSSAGILCAIRSFEEYRDSCVIHHATGRDLGGLFGVTFAKYGHSREEFDSGAEGNKRAGDGPARNNGLTPAYIGLSSFLGCDHRSLPLGIYAHNLAKQISDDWGGGHVGSEGTLSCKTGQHEEIEHFTFREHHCKGYKRQNEKFSLLLSPQIPQIKSFTSFSLPHKAVWAKIRKARYSRGNWSALCGNGRLDRNESCDPGILGANDPCCTETCMLRSHAYCSPFHHPCCTRNCKIAPASKRCNHSMDEKNSCVVSNSFCNGVDATVCPYNRKDTTNAEEFSACGENRVCISGKCVACCTEEHLRPSASQRNTEICSCTMLSLSKYTGRKKVVCKSCCEKTQYYPDVCKAVTTMGVDGEACVFANCSVVGCFVALHRSTLDFDYIKEHNVEDISPKGKENNWGLSVMESIFRALYIILSAAMLIMFLAFVIVITTPYILKRNATHTIENNARPEPVPPEEMRLRSVRLQPKLRSLV